MDNLKLALIGCGKLGKAHARCMRDIDGAEFIGYVDVHEASARDALEAYGGRYATSDVERVWRDDAVDGVYICTRHDSHASLAIAAAEAGKHVFIEKPLALTLEDCEAVVEAVRRHGVYFMPAFKMRYAPLIREARQFLPRPQVLVCQMMDGPWPDHKWVQDPVQGGANVYSQGPHTTDMLRYLSGSEPKTVWATGGTMTHPGNPCTDQCVASIRFASGQVASWIQGDAANPPFTSKLFFQLFADGKSVQIHDRLKQATFHDGESTWTRQRDEEEGMLEENREFIQALRESRPPEVTAYDGIQATRLVLAADRAIRTGEVQAL